MDVSSFYKTVEINSQPSLRDSALPQGFSLYGLRCGISSKPGKKDLALFYSHCPAKSAGVFTKSLYRAAPVLLSQRHLKESADSQAILINSGCANACTGTRGAADSLWSVQTLAKGLGFPVEKILVASTGVIGRYLPRPALQRGINDLVRYIKRDEVSSVKDAVHAIMTTDTREKAAHAQFSFKGKTYKLWGCVKGAGMIHPNMATMLSVILTDIGLPSGELRPSLRGVVERTFNRVSVDGDTSTNDSVFLLANGSAGEFSKVSPALRTLFQSALHKVCLSLSAQIAADGEGATKMAWIFVQGAPTEKMAAQLAGVVATSPLVKTALHGADPNWGRVLAALGRAGVNFNPDKVEVKFGNIVVCRNGQRVEHSEKQVHEILKKDRVTIVVDLHQGKAWSHYVTCDYSRDYISINADYTT